MHTLVRDLEKTKAFSMVYRFGENVHVTDTNNSGDFKSELQNALKESGHQDVLIKEIDPVIEDCFLALMDKDQIR